MSSRGRGAHYHPARQFLEGALQRLYRGDWPAKLWALHPRAHALRYVRHRLPILPPSAASLRVGFVSDLHIGPTTPPALLDAAFALLAQAAPDVLLLGGDYVFLEASPAKAARLAELVRRVPARHKLAVMGNHDLWTDHGLLERCLRDSGVTVLENQSVSLGADVAIVGLDEPWTGAIDAARAMHALETEPLVIVLCHSPDGLPYATRELRAMPHAPAGLFLCGHTHGGQIAAPWGPLVVPGVVGKRYPHGLHGLHELPPLQLYVSRGVGATELPMRTYAPPEVAVFELENRPRESPTEASPQLGAC